jgi:glucose-6-phosphate isomerase
MAVEALQFYKNNLNIHFVSNVDGDHVNEIIKTKSRNNTFVIVPRLYNQETLTNSETIRKWFYLRNLVQAKRMAKHFVAVSNIEKVTKFGINQNNVFRCGIG